MGSSYKTYPKHHLPDGENGYTADEIRRGVHWLYTDVTCGHCGKVQPVAATGGVGGPCVRCGKPT